MGADDHMLHATVAAMRVGEIFVIGGRHHAGECGERGIIDQRDVVPLVALLHTERDSLGVAVHSSVPPRALIIGTVRAL